MENYLLSGSRKEVTVKSTQVFSEDVRPMKKFKASLHLKPGSQLKFSEARPIPFVVKGATDST